MLLWQRWGLRKNPYSTEPIGENTLALFVGRQKEISRCVGGLNIANCRIVIEGGRGVGTTSLGNFLRFSEKNKGTFFTPIVEISLHRGYTLEQLAANILSAISWGLEYKHPEIAKNKKFKSVKSITRHVEERFKSVGVQIFGVGGEYGETGVRTQSAFFPMTSLLENINSIKELIHKLGYKRGIIIQINNLDLNISFNETEMAAFLNEARDFMQMDGLNWLLVGDSGLRGFIARRVDRLDDIITVETDVNALPLEEVKTLIDRRMEVYAATSKPKHPIEIPVIEYLYRITEGRLRYIFGICTRILTELSTEQIIESIELKTAAPLISKIAMERINQRGVTGSDLEVVRVIVEKGKSTNAELSKRLEKAQTAISRSLSELVKVKLIYFIREGRQKWYYPTIDAKIAYHR